MTHTDPPITVVPPFVLPDRSGKSFNTARLRGRRYAIMLFLSPDDADAAAYLQSFAARREEFAWLHTEVIVIVPGNATVERLPALPFPILRDDGQVRARILPGIAPEVMALLVTDLSGEVTTWRTARRIVSLPDSDAALAAAWDVARPKGSCGGVTWTPTANPAPPPVPPAPISRFTVGTHRRNGYHRGRSNEQQVTSNETGRHRHHSLLVTRYFSLAPLRTCYTSPTVLSSHASLWHVSCVCSGYERSLRS